MLLFSKLAKVYTCFIFTEHFYCLDNLVDNNMFDFVKKNI